MASFAGFPPEALRFLDQLGKNNDRAWFQAHRDEYEGLLLEPARDFVEAMGAELGPEVNADPRVGGSIFRINRDTRFSKDKRPYKNHLDLWFWQGEGPSRGRPGYFFRLTPDRLYLGAGMHGFERDLLERYREAVVDPKRGTALARAVAASKGELGGRTLKRVPRGFDPAHERAGLLLHTGLYAGVELTIPEETHTPRFPKFVAQRFRRVAPLQDWLVELAGS